MSEIGEAKVSGDRIISIDWNDIKAWIDVTGAIITPGEAEALRHLSSAYVSQYYDAMDDNCVAPHIKEINNDAVENKLKNLFAILRN